MCSDNPQSTGTNPLTRFEKITKLIEIVVVTIGVSIAFCALTVYQKANTEYHKSNIVSMYSKLTEQETRLYDRMYQNDTLNSFWAGLPEGLSIKEKADARLALLFVKDNKEGKASPTQTLKWNNIKDLDDQIWSHDTFGNPNYRQLRDGFNYAEEILYMQASAYFSIDQKLMTEEEGEAFSTFIEDIGEHPLYLAAVAWNHDYGGITKPIAKRIKETYQKNTNLKEVALAFYPEMINDPGWVDKTGTKK